MSQDLLSFLDEPPGNTGHQSTNTEPLAEKKYSKDLQDFPFGDASQANPTTRPAGPPPSNIDDDDDDFGDFETASPAPATPAPAPPAPAPVTAAVSRSTTPQAASNAPKPAPQPSHPQPKHPPEKPRSAFPPTAAKPSAPPAPPQSTRPSQPPTTRTSQPPAPKSAPKPKSQPPGSKPPSQPEVGRHPFANHMDLLFSMSDDEDEYNAGADELGDLSTNPEAAMAFSKRVIAEQEESSRGKGKGDGEGKKGGEKGLDGKAKGVGVVSLSGAGDWEVRGQAKAKGKDGGVEKKAKAKDPNVLFDAEDASDDGFGGEEDDDFGEFETWDAPATSSAPAPPAASSAQTLASEMDLLGLDDTSAPQTKASSPPKAIAAPVQPATSQKPAAPMSSSAAVHHQSDDSFWDDFDTPTPSTRPDLQPPQQEDWPDFDDAAPTPPSAPPSTAQTTPPTNIPPPLTLLTLYTPLLTTFTAQLLQPLSNLPTPAARQNFLSQPITQATLRTHLRDLHVLAHILAGRKLRWKRDQRLSQSMRIGPAGGKGGGGMKLTGLDKTETAKEEREVLDVIRLYRSQIGKLRSALTAASNNPKLPAPPDLQPTLPLKTLTQSEGGFTAREPCALCGLKREERVLKVDEGVEDSFGEWWNEGRGMHVRCSAFWDEREGGLKGR